MSKYETFTQARVVRGGVVVVKDVCFAEAIGLHSIISATDSLDKMGSITDFVLETYADEIANIINERSLHKRKTGGRQILIRDETSS